MSRNEEARPSISPRALAVFVVLHALAAVGYGYVHWHDTMSLFNVMLMDFGASYRAVQILGEGLVPQEDFGYSYGLLGLAVLKGYHQAVGLSLKLHAGLIYVCILGCFGILYALLYSIRPPRFACLLVLAGSFYYFNVAATPIHALEALLLTMALALIRTGRVPLALAAASGAYFVKPSICVFFILWCLGLIARDLYRQWSLARLMDALLPAAVAVAVACAVIIGTFGTGPFQVSLYPRSALGTYQHYGFGLHQILELFRHPGGPVATLKKVFLGQQLLLLAAAFAFLTATVRLWRQPELRRSADFRFAYSLSCIYVLFILTMYGNEFTWLNYAYLLPWTLSLSAFRRPGEPAWRTSAACMLFLVLIVVSMQAPVRHFTLRALTAQPVVRHHNTVYRINQRDVDVDEMLAGLNRDRSRHTFFLAWGGCPSELYEHFRTVRSWTLLGGAMTQAETDRLLAELQAADIVVVEKSFLSPLHIPAVRAILEARAASPDWQVTRGVDLDVYKKVR